MTIRREEVVRRRLEALLDVLASDYPEGTQASAPRGVVPADVATACVEAALRSRLLDLKARELKNRGDGFYTIGSAGHEANAMLGYLTRSTDPSLLHYRSGGFVAARTGKEPGETFLSDVLLSFCASAEEPVSGGRHKVWGSRRLWIPPQTSTIASQLPKAVGMAFAIARASHLGIQDTAPDDAIVCTSFGDASMNHASATTALNAACWAAHQHIPMPVLFVCEDNGLGISVHTPKTWIRSAIGSREEIAYFEADGNDLDELFTAARRAIEHCRVARRPCFLRIGVVRLLGHAGSDVESQYHNESFIEATESRDPLLAWCRLVVERGHVSGSVLREHYDRIASQIDRVARRSVTRPRLESAEEITRDLRFPDWPSLRPEATRSATEEVRLRHFDGSLPEDDRPRHMAMLLSRALADLMLVYPEMLVFGEDVAKKGGVYHVTAGLYEHFGVGRVFNTLLDETMILGLAIGAAQIGLLPVPEIQYLAYLHNAEDQLRGEACSQRFFSRAQWDNPMVVRIASFAYQKGFGGHFHNDNSIGVLRDIPGLVIAAPSRGDDAVGMLRTCIAAARAGGAVCAFLEPIALYMTRDLFEKGDGKWSFAYPAPGTATPFATPRFYEADSEIPSRGGPKILVATYGNGVPMALRARRALGAEADIAIMDLRWLSPLPIDDWIQRASESDAVLVLDECRRTGGGVAEALLSALVESDRTRGLPARRVTGVDTYIPLGAAANLVLPDEAQVEAALRSLIAEMRRA